MKANNTIRQLFIEFVKDLLHPPQYAIVKSVDEAKRICSVMLGGITRENVLLYGVLDDSKKGFCFIPKIDSKVVITTISDTRSYVSLFSEIDKVLVTIGDKVEVLVDAEKLYYKNDKSELTVSAKDLQFKNDKTSLIITEDKVELASDAIEFNGGKNNGLVKIKELEKNLDSLKKYVEAINMALPSAFTAVGAAMAAAGPLGATAYQGAMAGKIIMFEKMENDKIKH